MNNNTQIFDTKIVGTDLRVTIKRLKYKIKVTVEVLGSSSISSVTKKFDTEEQAKEWADYKLHRFYLKKHF